MVPDVVPPPPPPPPMPSANYVPTPKPVLTIVKSDRAPSPPKNPLATNDSFDNVINEIKSKGGTLRKTARKESVPLEDCIVPTINFTVTANAKPTFKNEIVINVKNSTALHSENDTTTESCTKLSGHHLNDGIAYKLRRPSDFHNGIKPELPTKKKEVVTKPQLPPKSFLNGKSTANGIKKNCAELQKPSIVQHPERTLGLIGSTIQRLTSTEPDSPTETPFKRNQVLTRSTSDGIGSTIQKLERQTTETSSRTPPSFQRSNSVRQRINQMNQVDNSTTATVRDGTRTIGRRPMVSRPTNLPRPSIGTMKLLNDLQHSLHHNPSGNVVRLENEEARIGTTVNVADVTGGTVTASDPNVKKLVYNTYRNFLGAYNTKANNVVTNQNGRMAAAVVVVQDKGVAEQLGKIAQNGNITNLTGRAIQKTDD